MGFFWYTLLNEEGKKNIKENIEYVTFWKRKGGNHNKTYINHLGEKHTNIERNQNACFGEIEVKEGKGK